jgi:hypothetical protein
MNTNVTVLLRSLQSMQLSSAKSTSVFSFSCVCVCCDVGHGQVCEGGSDDSVARHTRAACHGQLGKKSAFHVPTEGQRGQEEAGSRNARTAPSLHRRLCHWRTCRHRQLLLLSVRRENRTYIQLFDVDLNI